MSKKRKPKKGIDEIGPDAAGALLYGMMDLLDKVFADQHIKKPKTVILIVADDASNPQMMTSTTPEETLLTLVERLPGEQKPKPVCP